MSAWYDTICLLNNNCCIKTCRNGRCDRNLTSNSPFAQYQRQKIIQNTVRVPASMFTMNLGALSVYQAPTGPLGVNWNQMSDRAIPHEQTATAPRNASSTKRSVTRLRPGALSPGGVGVDIKHNSYDRYLARIKGKGPLRREINPVDLLLRKTGGKDIKTNIVSGCDCTKSSIKNEEIICHYNHLSLNDVMFSSETYVGCQSEADYDTQPCIPSICLPTVKLIEEYLTNCPDNAEIHIL